MNRIQTFNTLKERLSVGAFECIERERTESDHIAHDIDVIVDSFWATHDNHSVMQPTVDLNELCAFHLNLIESVSNRIRAEYSSINEGILRAHLSAREVLENDKIENGKMADAIVLFSAAKSYYLIGDIHSDYSSLKRIFQTTAFFETMNDDNPSHLIFMGDYVDRGKAHLKTMEYLLIMKALFPKRITLLRGNHDGGILIESGITRLPYRIPETDNPLDYFPRYLEALCVSNASFSNNVLPAYLNLFDALPYIAFIKTGDKVVECVHGGLPKPVAKLYAHLKCLSDLTLYSDLDNASSTIRQNIMWSDPQREGEDVSLTGKRFNYSEAHFDNYSKYFHIDTLYRGHEVVEDGIQSHFGDKVFTVFSTGNSPDTYYHWVSPKIVELKPSGGKKFLSLTEDL
jgi:predicted phosphodiesterase